MLGSPCRQKISRAWLGSTGPEHGRWHNAGPRKCWSAAMRIVPLALATCTALGLAACGSTPPQQPAPPPAHAEHDAVANLASASGSLVSGRLQVMTMGANGVHI